MNNPLQTRSPDAPRVVIVGGGLAGMAAAAALVTRGARVTLLESRRRLGGRAGSYVDRETGELIDHCQHVAMGCCTNYLDFCRQTGIDQLFARYTELHFFGPDGRRCDFRPASWLPAPLHLLPALWGLKYLTNSCRVAICRAMLRLAREPVTAEDPTTMLDWLDGRAQPAAAIELFWQPVLVSALGDTLDRVSVAASRKVFVDGFMGAREASHMLVPKTSLEELYDGRAAEWLRRQGVDVRLETAVERVTVRADGRVAGVQLGGGGTLPADFVVVAVPWRKVTELLPESPLLEPLHRARQLQSAPITGVHLWFDRPLFDLPQAVLVGRLSQWVFRRSFQDTDAAWYCQVVISGSHELEGRPRQAVLDEVLSDLANAWPAAREAKLLRWKIISEPESVFSMQPGAESLRPGQRTAMPGLLVAGDWTRTGWPATMEGAVRSGYLAAEAVLEDVGRFEQVLAPDLPREWLARWVLP